MSQSSRDAHSHHQSRDLIQHDATGDGIDRRGFLRCMAWAGTGMLWALEGGVLSSRALARTPGDGASTSAADLFFVQISDSHIGFAKDPNHDVAATLGEAVRRINGLPSEPAFLLHTGDISQLSKPEEFDAAQQIIAGARTRSGDVHYVPGEHDVLDGTGKLYLERYGRKARGQGWYSFDYCGVHFVGLVNVLDLKPGGLGNLGAEQLEWLNSDLKSYSTSTPVVVFAHVPLWTVYPAWGWGTDDSEQALGYLRRFGSVSVLNGHIHQVMQKVEGNVTFHTAMSTAFPQPVPGTAPSPGPMPVQAERLRDLLGLASVSFTRGHKHLAVVDSTMSGVPLAAAQAEWPYVANGAAASGESAPQGEATAAAPGAIAIANFTFAPATLHVRAGDTITFTNRDDTAHRIASADGSFKPSTALDTNETFQLKLTRPGTYRYFCSIHPQMQGTIEVR
jgi:plastocyanin